MARAYPDPLRHPMPADTGTTALSLGFTGAAAPCELVDETPIAFVCAGVTIAVMMATPSDLEDFAVGLTWTEGLVSRAMSADQIQIIARPNGIECRLALDPARSRELQQRLRAIVSPSACGLCGVRSIAQAVPAPPSVAGASLRFPLQLVHDAVLRLRAMQPLHDRTHAAHAAGFIVPQRGIVCVREDIGRHNALDKLVGALLRCGENPSAGAILLTSRVSVEMVQKAAALGVPVIIAVSAPSALGVRVAKAAGITLITNVRRGSEVVHTHPYRVTAACSAHPSGDFSAREQVRPAV